MYSVNAPEFSRNYGFWNEAEQQAVNDSHVVLAGVGGDGYLLGTTLAKMGVQRITAADPEVFELENINRVPGATTETVGQKKVDVFRDEILRINPEAEVRVFSDGITEDNIDDVVEGATLTFDETELTHLQLGTMLARAARRRRVANVLVMNIGFAAQVTSFHPEGRTFEDMMGFPNDMPLSEVAEQRLDLSRCVPYLPPYVDVTTLEEVQKGASLPSIAQGVNQAAAMGASQAFLHMVKGVGNRRPEPLWAPKVAYMDSLTFESGVTRFPRASHYKHLAEMVLRDKMGVNPEASYSAEEREHREAEHEAYLAALQSDEPVRGGRHARRG